MLILYVLMRFGLLAVAGMAFLPVHALHTPISVSSWYAGAPLKPAVTSSPTPPSS